MLTLYDAHTRSSYLIREPSQEPLQGKQVVVYACRAIAYARKCDQACGQALALAHTKVDSNFTHSCNLKAEWRGAAGKTSKSIPIITKTYPCARLLRYECMHTLSPYSSNEAYSRLQTTYLLQSGALERTDTGAADTTQRVILADVWTHYYQ